MTNWLDILAGINEEKGSTALRSQPLYVLIHNRIKEAIDDGRLPADTKLPTNRELANLLKVDRSTAARAYAELANEGCIESFVGRGTFVASSRPGRNDPFESTEPDNSISWPDKFSRASQTVYEMLRLEQANIGWQQEVISFAGGIPTDESYPHKDFERILEKLIAAGRSAEMYQYSPNEGLPALRKEVRKHLAKQGIDASDDKLLILGGSQQGLDVVANILLDPGDLVVVEDPTYLWATCNFKSRGARCTAVPLDDQGIRIDILEAILQRQRPKFIYVIPNFQNPTGITMSYERRRQLLLLANQYQVPILEDNFVGDLRYDGESLPSLRAMPGSENLVIHLGTFSKALCPALRLGWLVAPPETMPRLVIAKRSSNLTTNSISQVILAEFLKEGLYEQHLATIRNTYRARRDAMLRALHKELFILADQQGDRTRITWSRPHGGMFIWLKLPDGLSSRELLPYAQREGVAYAPGDVCFLSQEQSECLRLCFIQLDEANIAKGVKRLGKAIRSYLEDVSNKSLSNRSHLMGTGSHSFI